MKNHLVMAGAIVAALAIPLAANAQNNATTGAVGVRSAALSSVALLVRLSEESAVRLSEELPTIDVRNSALTLCSKEGALTNMTAMLWLAPNSVRPASSIIRCQQNTA